MCVCVSSDSLCQGWSCDGCQQEEEEKEEKEEEEEEEGEGEESSTTTDLDILPIFNVTLERITTLGTLPRWILSTVLGSNNLRLRTPFVPQNCDKRQSGNTAREG